MCMTQKRSYFRHKFMPGYYLKVANKDIVCYKVYNRISGDSSRLISHHRKEVVEFPSTLKSLDPNLIVPVLNDRPFIDAIVKGIFVDFNYGYHSYVNLLDAGRNIGGQLSMQTKIIIECVIPKGATYFEGYFNVDTTPNYVSSELKLLRSVSVDKYNPDLHRHLEKMKVDITQ